MSEFDNYKLGVDDKIIQLNLRDENRELITNLVKQGERSVEIISRLLDPFIYDSTGFIEGIKQFVLDNRRCKVRIIVFDPATIVKNGHRLVNLAGDLSSFIEIRKADHQFKEYNESLFLIDDVAYVHRINGERFEAVANFKDKRQSKYLLKEFNTMWDSSKPDPNMRRMVV